MPNSAESVPHAETSGTKPRIVIAGQIPPPICGQNLYIALALQILEKAALFDVYHWEFRFTPSWNTMRRASWKKSVELIRVLFRLLRLRFAGPIDAILYPVGGPHLAPAIRDLALLPLALLCSKKVILHFHAAGLAGALLKFPRPIAFLLKKLYATCNHAVALTEFGKKDPQAGGIKNITVIPNAREDHFDPDWKKAPDHENNAPITILNVGLLCSDKGTPQLLEAFAILHRAHPNTVLKLVGAPMAGLSHGDILQKATQLGIADAVQLPGVLNGEALQRAYAEADIFAFTTIAPFESFGMVLTEAMMWALPIVATDWRANSEVLGKNHGGELAEVGENLPENLAEAIQKVIHQRPRWDELGQINRDRFLKHYQIDTLQTNLVELFKGSDPTGSAR